MHVLGDKHELIIDFQIKRFKYKTSPLCPPWRLVSLVLVFTHINLLVALHLTNFITVIYQNTHTHTQSHHIQK